MERCVLATGGYDNTVRFWRADSGSCSRTLQHADSQVNYLEITHDKQAVASAGNGQIRFYDVNSHVATPVAMYEGHQGNVTCVGFAADGTWMYSGGEDETVKIWDLRASKSNEYQRDFNHLSPVTCVALHPNQGELISGDHEGRIVRWDLKANRCTEHLIPEPNTAVRSIAISSDGQYMAAVNNEGNCYIWKLNGPEVKALKKIVVHRKSYVLKCAFSKDVTRFATTSSDRSCHVYDVEAGFQLVHSLKGHQMWVWDVAFSADSHFAVTVSSDKTGRIWDITDGTTSIELKGHQRAITALALNDS